MVKFDMNLFRMNFHNVQRSRLMDKGLGVLGTIAILLLLTGCSNDPVPTGPQKFSYAIVAEFPHDPQAFTQGLAWDQGVVYEGTGKYGSSTLRRVELETGKVEQKIAYATNIFAEGITVFQEKIFQLTWKNNIVLVYDKYDFSPVKSYEYPLEGWGLTHNNEDLIASDGTATLYFLDPATLSVKKSIIVHDNGVDIHSLNELEYIQGKVYANIWQSDRIAIINPDNGMVEGWIDLSGLRGHLDPDGKVDVLNGIMCDPEGERLFVTGKFWPTLFEIRLVPSTR